MRTGDAHGALAAPLRRVGDVLPPAAVVLVLAGQLLVPGGWSRAAWVPLAVALVVGLPHGAVDHLVPAWVSARRLSRRVLTAVAAGYAGVAAGAFVLLRLAPLPGVLAFLAVSVVHFGAGEVAYDRLRGPVTGERPPPGVPVGIGPAAGVFAWGGTVVLLPLARWPEQVRPVLDALAPGSGGLLTPAVRAVTTALVLGVAGTVAAGMLSAGRHRPAGELLLLTALVLLVPPLPAFAVYFGAWHSLRHVLRMLGTDPANADALAAGRLVAPVRRFAVQALAPTAASLAVLALLLSGLRSGAGAAGFVSTDLSLLAALTVPHMAVVAWLDRQASTPERPRVRPARWCDLPRGAHGGPRPATRR